MSADQRPPSRSTPFEYRYLTEFQSHEPEFDYLKSQEIEEKINKVRWCRTSAGSRMLLSTNDKTIKLWKVFEKRIMSLTEFNVNGTASAAWYVWEGGCAWSLNTQHGCALQKKLLSFVDNFINIISLRANGYPNGTANGVSHKLKVPKVASVTRQLASKCRRTYQNAHTYHINSISVNSDQETFLSADDLRINLWHLDVVDQSFNIVDIKPSQMEDLTEVRHNTYRVSCVDNICFERYFT